MRWHPSRRSGLRASKAGCSCSTSPRPSGRPTAPSPPPRDSSSCAPPLSPLLLGSLGSNRDFADGTAVWLVVQTIRDKKDENWWQVTVSGVQGTVPASMVEVIREEEKLTHLTQLNAGGCVSSAIYLPPLAARGLLSECAGNVAQRGELSAGAQRGVQGPRGRRPPGIPRQDQQQVRPCWLRRSRWAQAAGAGASQEEGGLEGEILRPPRWRGPVARETPPQPWPLRLAPCPWPWLCDAPTHAHAAPGPCPWPCPPLAPDPLLAPALALAPGPLPLALAV